MVMFQGIQDALDSGTQPRKTDILQANQSQQQPDQQGQPPGQPAMPTDTAITSDNAAASKTGAQTPQASRSPQAVLEANKDVKIENSAASRDLKNAQTIADNRIALQKASYTPKPTNNLQKNRDFVESGTEFEPDQAPTQAPKLQTDDVAGIQTDYSKHPFAGINNALDRAIAGKSDYYTQQGLAAQQGIAGQVGRLHAADDEAQNLWFDADQKSKQDAAQIPSYLQGRLQYLQGIGQQGKQAAMGQLKTQNNQLADQASQFRGKLLKQVQAALPTTFGAQYAIGGTPQYSRGGNSTDEAKGYVEAAGVDTTPFISPATGEFDPESYLSNDQWAQENRVRRLLGQPELAAQPHQTAIKAGAFNQQKYIQSVGAGLDKQLGGVGRPRTPTQEPTGGYALIESIMNGTVKPVQGTPTSNYGNTAGIAGEYADKKVGK